MLSHPDQLALALDGVVGWDRVFEEYVRWMSPIGMSPRRIAVDARVAGTDITAGQVMSAAPERLSLDETTVGDVAMMCVRDSAALIAVVDEQGCIVGALRQDDVLTNARVNGDDASPR